MISKKSSKTVMKVLYHKKKLNASLNDIINKNYKLAPIGGVGWWWILGF